MTGPPAVALAGGSESEPMGQVGCDLPDERRVRDLMWTRVGLVRDRAGLAPAVTVLAGWRHALARAVRPSGAETRARRRLSSLVTVGYLIACAALRREESRGGHFRSDFPARDDIHWQKHVSDRLGPV
jgi:L-aspartate oxidase